MRTLTLLPLLLLIGATRVTQPLEYSFEQTSGKVVLQRGHSNQQAAAGTVAIGGDHVMTGWRGRAIVAAEARKSRFEIFPATVVQLASEDPGVLVVLERGKLKAIFDAITGNDPRVVKTPGATLAVRGTRYGVEVEPDGTTTLVVFEGKVLVQSTTAQFGPILIGPGEACDFTPRRAPRAIPMARGLDERGWERGHPIRDGEHHGRPDDAPDRSGMSGGSGNGSSGSGHTGHRGSSGRRP